MRKLIFLFGLATAVISLLGTPVTAQAANMKIQICHIPPDDPGNFHTIIVSEKAATAHLAHGDLLGACDIDAETRCDDENPCTIDAFLPGTLICDNSQPIDCSDDSSCTNDSCNPATGCINAEVICEQENCSSLSVCDPLSGSNECVSTPAVCEEGFECNPANGECELIPVECPCEGLTRTIAGTAIPWNDSFTPRICVSIARTLVLETNRLSSPELSLAASSTATNGVPGNCGWANRSEAERINPITDAEAEACKESLRQIAANDGVVCGEF
jgi:Dictyostelium (slime mold) repeat